MILGMFDANVSICTVICCTVYIDFLLGLVFSLLVSSLSCLRFLPGDVVGIVLYNDVG